MERGVAGIWNLPIGIRLELQQQLDQLSLALFDSSNQQGLVGCLPIYLHLTKRTKDASR